MQKIPKKLIDRSIRNVKDDILDFYQRAADRMFPKPFPNGRAFRRLLPVSKPVHLVAIATKR